MWEYYRESLLPKNIYSDISRCITNSTSTLPISSLSPLIRCFDLTRVIRKYFRSWLDSEAMWLTKLMKIWKKCLGKQILFQDQGTHRQWTVTVNCLITFEMSQSWWQCKWYQACLQPPLDCFIPLVDSFSRSILITGNLPARFWSMHKNVQTKVKSDLVAKLLNAFRRSEAVTFTFW